VYLQLQKRKFNDKSGLNIKELLYICLRYKNIYKEK
jgi:hypothetical protein